jgi:peptidoglycan/LPS O-acetylase OafA/YrhL
MGNASLDAVPATGQARSVPILNRLTGIRAVAAIFVVALHYGDSISTIFPLFGKIRPIYRAGGMGVDLFFILSGFILSHNYLKQFASVSMKEYKSFLVARLARVYPVHLTTLLFLTVLVAVAAHAGKPMSGTHYSVQRWVENLLLVQTWPSFGNAVSWNYPAWSVSAEWFAYLLFPLLAAGIVRVQRPAIFCVVSLALYVVPACLGWVPESAPSNWAILRVTSEFLYGSFLYRLYSRGDRCPLSPLYAGALSIVLTLMCSYLSLHPTWAVPAYGILLWSLADRPHGPLDGKVIVYLGQVSYSLYMTHGVVQIVLNKLCPVEHFAHGSLVVRSSLLCVYIFLIAGAAIGTYHCVEAPGRRAMLLLLKAKRSIVPQEKPKIQSVATEMQ